MGFSRKFLSADGLLSSVRRSLNRETFKPCQSPYRWDDCIMSGLAVFGFKFPSLLQIVSSNEFNQSKIKTVLVAIVTSNLHLAEAPGNFSISKKDSGLSKESVVNVSQVLTLDKSLLSEKSGKLPSNKILILNEGLRLVLST